MPSFIFEMPLALAAITLQQVSAQTAQAHSCGSASAVIADCCIHLPLLEGGGVQSPNPRPFSSDERVVDYAEIR